MIDRSRETQVGVTRVELTFFWSETGLNVAVWPAHLHLVTVLSV